MKRRGGSHTKLIATLGPASSKREVLRRMYMEGIDVCRLNLSHGTRESHASSAALVRELNGELNAEVAILADLQGPKLRIGTISCEPVMLREGEDFFLTTEACAGSESRVHINYSQLPVDVNKGDSILIDDGRIMLEVTATDGKKSVRTRVVHGGPLHSKKGVNLPDTELSLQGMTEKDIDDTRFALELGVDWIALSFVRSAEDIIQLRKLISDSGGSARIVAKIEKREALEDLQRIIQESDAVMVARGDLGVEAGFHRVPMIQKQIVDECVRQATPVIIATQMMESMIGSFRPTRAEATDVANAVLDGADSLMLSGETSIGRYPDLVVRNMQSIIDWTEQHGNSYFTGHAPSEDSHLYFPDSICFSATQLARQTGARAIVTYTHSGYTAVRISSHRPRSDIYAFTMNRDLLPMLSMVWGVHAFYLESSGNMEEYLDRSMSLLRERELVEPGDVVVHVGSIPLLLHGKTNMLKLTRVGD